MTGINTVARPKGFKSIALAGVFSNTLFLAVIYPGLIYLQYKNPDEIAILRIMSLFSWFIYLPLTVILLVGSIGLLFKQYWSRSLCLWALTADIILGVCYIVIDNSVRIANWNNDTIFSLASIPIYILIYILEGGVIYYLNRKRVDQYLDKCRFNANGS